MNRKSKKPKKLKYVEKLEDDGTGGKVKVRRFKDGSSEVMWGGPCGSQKFDKFGNSN